MKRTVELFLLDGTPNGCLQAKLDNWTGLAFRWPVASKIDDDIEALHYSGVYLLLGQGDGQTLPQVYVGQAASRKNGRSVLQRLAEHLKDERKHFATQVVFLTTQTESFGLTELAYLENRLWVLATNAGRYRVTNNAEPAISTVTASKKAELDRYLDNAKILLSTLGFPVLESKADEVRSDKDIASPSGEFVLRKPSQPQLLGMGKETRDGFVLLEGSYVSREIYVSCPTSVKRLREQLTAQKVLVLNAKDDTVYRLTKALIMSSTSQAAAFVLGHSAQGPALWKTHDGLSYQEVMGATAKK